MEFWVEIKKVRNRAILQTSNLGGSALKSNGLSRNGRVINYTQLMANRQASMRGNVSKDAGNYDEIYAYNVVSRNVGYRPYHK